jgi:hypothetical protein
MLGAEEELREADRLRQRAVAELVARRSETEWFIEGDFDDYVTTMAAPHTWGGATLIPPSRPAARQLH